MVDLKTADLFSNRNRYFANEEINKMLISDGINHNKLQSIIVGELKKAGFKHRLKKIILKNVKVSTVQHFRLLTRITIQ